MFSHMKQVFTVLLTFSESSAHTAKVGTKCLSLNDEPCLVRPIFIDLNHVEFKYYSFMISLAKCNGSCNVLSPKICIPKKTQKKTDSNNKKNINFKVFNMITNKAKTKTMVKHKLKQL